MITSLPRMSAPTPTSRPTPRLRLIQAAPIRRTEEPGGMTPGAGACMEGITRSLFGYEILLGPFADDESD